MVQIHAGEGLRPDHGKRDRNGEALPAFHRCHDLWISYSTATDVEVRDGEFTWDFAPEGFSSEFSHSPIAFHDPSQIVGAPFLDEDRFIIKFNCFWNIEAPPGYSLLFTHPVNRADLPFTTLTGLVDSDTFHHSPLSFPARWHDVQFNGVLPKGTPVAQCLPVKRESWIGRFEVLTKRPPTG